MRMSAHRIRAINRAVAKVNGIVCGASDGPRHLPQPQPTTPSGTKPPHTLRIVAVPPLRTT